MVFGITNLLRDTHRTDGVDPAMDEYEALYTESTRGGLDSRASSHRTFNDIYYDLVSDFFEFGWGRSFHFAPRVPGESFKASLARHEHYIAHVLGLRPGMVVADFGCGIGGPLIEIARFSGARIVGINSNAHQLKRGRALTEEAGLSDQSEFMHCDFLDVDAPDHSFDAIYSIEATCVAPDKRSVYSEVFRLLKPGGSFAAYEYCMTDRFDETNPHHLRLKADIQLGGGLLVIDRPQTVNDALRTLGFEVLETRDLAEYPPPPVPWYQPLAAPGLSLAGLGSSRLGRGLTQHSLRVLEAIHVVPEGAARVSRNLNLCAAAMAEAGRLGIFTPMYFLLARKPA